MNVIFVQEAQAITRKRPRLVIHRNHLAILAVERWGRPCLRTMRSWGHHHGTNLFEPRCLTQPWLPKCQALLSKTMFSQQLVATQRIVLGDGLAGCQGSLSSLAAPTAARYNLRDAIAQKYTPLGDEDDAATGNCRGKPRHFFGFTYQPQMANC